MRSSENNFMPWIWVMEKQNEPKETWRIGCECGHVPTRVPHAAAMTRPRPPRWHVGSSARFALRYNEHVPAGREPDEFYAILGLAPDAGVDDIRRAYHQLAMRWHPDRAGPDATFIFQRLSAAYQVLTDPVAHAAYDRERGVGSGPGEPVPPARRAPGVLIRRLRLADRRAARMRNRRARR